MLLTCLGLLSFLTLEFESFLRYTACERIYKYILANARGVKLLYKYNLNEYALVGMFVIVTAYLLSVPSRKSMIAKVLQTKKRERMEQNLEAD